MTAASRRRWRQRALLLAAGAAAARAALPALRAATRPHTTPAPPTPAPSGSDRSGPDPDLAGPSDARHPCASWERTNFRGRTVSLAAGPALAGAAALSAAAGAAAAGGPAAAAAVLAAGCGSGAAGLYDDLVGNRPAHRAKGFHGHLAALRQGRVTSGVVKIAGIGAAGLAAAALLPPRRPVRRRPARRSWSFHPTRRATRRQNSMINVVLGGGVIAGSANLLNLLDLRPGRALKAGLLAGVPLATGPAGGLAAGPVGAAAALLPEDLREQTMLGDCGANALGALLGTALAARTGPPGRAVALAVIAGLTAASERVSFTAVIARTPGLRELDGWGRDTGGPTRDTAVPSWAGDRPGR